MMLALTVNGWQEEALMFAQQFGVTHVVAETTLPEGEERAWNARTFAALRNRVEKAGLILAGLDALPFHPEACEAEIEPACRFIQDAGSAGIPLVGYEGNGEHGAAPDSESAFLTGALPVAEAAGVALARRATQAFARESRVNSSDSLDIWPGAISAQAGHDRAKSFCIREAGRAAILTLHNHREGTRGASEARMDEGDVNLVTLLRECRDAGFRGLIRPAPQPAVTGDTPWGHIAQAFAVGYLRALLQALEKVR